MVVRLSTLLEQLDKTTSQRVDQARKRFGPAIREALRQETGLLLNRSRIDSDGRQTGEGSTVPIQVTAALPEELHSFEFSDEVSLHILLSQHSSSMEHLQAGLPGVTHLYESLLATSPPPFSVTTDDVKLVRDLQAKIERMMATLTQANPVQAILHADEDVLGRYRYVVSQYREEWRGSIDLYWGVIGVVAKMLGVQIEPLAVVVLAHESAHAYTHLGIDIDGGRWSSSAFAETDLPLKEGLAQYYTLQICRRLESQASGLTDDLQEGARADNFISTRSGYGPCNHHPLVTVLLDQNLDLRVGEKLALLVQIIQSVLNFPGRQASHLHFSHQSHADFSLAINPNLPVHFILPKKRYFQQIFGTYLIVMVTHQSDAPYLGQELILQLILFSLGLGQGNHLVRGWLSGRAGTSVYQYQQGNYGPPPVRP